MNALAFTSQPADTSGNPTRAEDLLRVQHDALCRRTDRLFANLMLVQWAAGIAAALWISPRTWIGAQSQIHFHVWAAVFLGGLITMLPVFLARTLPGRPVTRHVIAVGQMLTAALFIHLTGGRIETHFHVFGSLAFLAIYRDWRVLVTATIVGAIDHFARGVFWPESVFGALDASHWRWVEHAGWMLFEDVFLCISIRQSLAGMREVAAAQRELIEISRQAGMAEVATAVLHNVGNVLNSVNISASCVASSLRNTKVASLTRIAAIFQEHESDLGAFFTNDPRAARLPAFLTQLSERLAEERTAALRELAYLQKNIEHIKEIVSFQQTYARVSGDKEVVSLTDLVEETLRVNAGSFDLRDVRIVREFSAVPPVAVEKHKVLQILINLVLNAKHACEATTRPDKTLALRIFSGDGHVKIAVSDNGVGIPAENLPRIFNHGFTTKKQGHGFGLHSGARAAREMGGALRVASAGPGEGATFTLELPLNNFLGK